MVLYFCTTSCSTDDADEVKDTFKQLDILLHKVEDEGYKISDVDEEFEEMLGKNYCDIWVPLASWLQLAF